MYLSVRVSEMRRQLTFICTPDPSVEIIAGGDSVKNNGARGFLTRHLLWIRIFTTEPVEL